MTNIIQILVSALEETIDQARVNAGLKSYMESNIVRKSSIASRQQAERII
jgi:hypothetical protein